MKKMTQKFLIIFLSILLSSCASVANKQVDVKNINNNGIKIPSPPENLASIYVWRENAFLLSAVDVMLAINDKSFARMSLKDYFVINLINIIC